MAQTAASKVLQIPELFEQILRELPQRDILLNVQRTCRAWKAVVDTSPPIQRRLFFAPARAGDDIEWEQRSLDICKSRQLISFSMTMLSTLQIPSRA